MCMCEWVWWYLCVGSCTHVRAYWEDGIWTLKQEECHVTLTGSEDKNNDQRTKK